MQDWVEAANTEVDEIWVPSPFNVQTFGRCGIDTSVSNWD